MYTCMYITIYLQITNINSQGSPTYAKPTVPKL